MLPVCITSCVIKTLTPAADWTAIVQKSQCYFDSSLALRFLSGPSFPLLSFDSSLVLWLHSKITVLLRFVAARFAKWRCSPRFCFFHSSVTTVTKFSTLRKPSNPYINITTNSCILSEISITIWKRWGTPHVCKSQHLCPVGQYILYVIAILCVFFNNIQNFCCP